MEWVRDLPGLHAALANDEPACVVLDTDTAGIAFEAAVKAIRDLRMQCSLIAVGAPKPMQHRIQLLDQGADDYMVKPFDLGELEARVRAVQRRQHRARKADEGISIGPLQLFPHRHAAAWNGRFLALSGREYALLEFLVQRKNQVVSRGQIHEALHVRGDETVCNAVEVYVHKLRRKTSPNPDRHAAWHGLSALHAVRLA